MHINLQLPWKYSQSLLRTQISPVTINWSTFMSPCRCSFSICLLPPVCQLMPSPLQSFSHKNQILQLESPRQGFRERRRGMSCSLATIPLKTSERRQTNPKDIDPLSLLPLFSNRNIQPLLRLKYHKVMQGINQR